MLTPVERTRVDAAGEGLYRTLHRDRVEDVLRDLRERRISAVIVSVARCGRLDRTETERMAALVREFPRIPAVALLTELVPETAQAVLSLGQSGVRSLVDVRQPQGWRDLRSLLAAEQETGIERLATARIAADIPGAPSDCLRFFELLFARRPQLATVRELASQLGVVPSTLMSRFFRARLPAPKRYLAMARLTRAARLFENPGFSVAAVANHLDYSSPQSFGRHVRTLLDMTAVDFRRRYSGESLLERFRTELVLPHTATLRAFSPLSSPPAWTRSGER
jgi:AraC-like DNA-binding protein